MVCGVAGRAMEDFRRHASGVYKQRCMAGAGQRQMERETEAAWIFIRCRQVFSGEEMLEVMITAVGPLGQPGGECHKRQKEEEGGDTAHGVSM